MPFLCSFTVSNKKLKLNGQLIQFSCSSIRVASIEENKTAIER